MSKNHRYVEVEGTAGNLFRRLAYDEVSTVTEHANRILELCRDKLSDADMATLKTLLMGGDAGEANEPVRSNGIEANRAGAQDGAISKLQQHLSRIGQVYGH